MCPIKVGKTYPDMSGQLMYVVRDVPKQELGQKVNPLFDYVEVVFANRRDQSNGWRRKSDGRYPVYAHWPQHPCHLKVECDK